MARSCGIRIGRAGFELVVLEGSAKKPKIAYHAVHRFPEDSEDLVAEMSAAIKGTLKGQKVPDENVGLAIDTGLAAFRTVKLPFEDKAKIEEVIKFEVESQLPQWDIDDVIVDFLPLVTSAVESTLLVTAVPKEDLGLRLSIAESCGLDPLEAELESTSMFNAAFEAGVLTEEAAQVLVHVGESSTSVVVVDGGILRSMRAIHEGALISSGGMRIGSRNEESGAEAPTLGEVFARVRRELGRTISGAQTVNPIEGIYVCGIDVDELVGDEVLDVPIQLLDVLPHEDGDPLENSPELVAAYGTALRQLGGGKLHPSLRREELKHLGKFERLELPLAILGLIAMAFLSVKLIIADKDLSKREEDVGRWYLNSNHWMLGDENRPPRLVRPPETIKEYVRKSQTNEVPEQTKFEQLKRVQRLLLAEIQPLKQKLGVDQGRVEQPLSAFEGLSLVLGVFDELGEQVGRYAIRKADAQYVAGSGTRPDRVEVTLDLSFFHESTVVASDHWHNWRQAVKGKSWIVEFPEAASDTMDGGGGIFVDRVRITIDPSKAEEVAS